MSFIINFIIAVCVIINGVESTEDPIITGYFSPHDVSIELEDSKNITLEITGTSDENIELDFIITNGKVLENISSVVLNTSYIQSAITVSLDPISVGHTVLYVNGIPSNMTDLTKAYVRISVSHSDSLDYLSDIVGWIYFLAWSISFYPQIIMNFRRKSVIGLHFDFLSLNVVGFLYYSIFNIGLYWIPIIETEYFARHQFGVNPVQLNDVIFAIHAFFACLIQGLQCVIYEKGEQKVSVTARIILAFIGVTTFGAFLILLNTSSSIGLDFLYIISYIKLFITLIKYIPQVYYNYRRKSTTGWSIGNVLLDFTGGSLSIAQMFIIAFNYNDWSSIFGDPTKFGLGLFSIMFDVVFIVQHYVLYKTTISYEPLLRSPEVSIRDPAALTVNADSGYSNYGAT